MDFIKGFFNEHKKLCLIAGCIILVIILSIISYFVIKANNNDKTSSTNIEETQEEETTESQTTETIETSSNEDDPQPQAMENESGAQVDASELNASDNDYEVSGLTYGIDVSKWQGKINWDKVKDTGIEFAMIRVGYRTEGNGTICEDAYAKYNLQQANAAGIKVGVYFFSTAVSTAEAKEEAAWVTNFIAKYKITYPVVYNCEGFSTTDSRMVHLTNTERTNNAFAFLSYISSAGYTPMLYASSSELSGSTSWNTDSISGSYKVWVAQYVSAYSSSSKTSYSGTYSMWQYTNKGTVNGISGYVDLNIAYFGYSQEATAKDSSGAEEVTAPTQSTTAYDPYQAANDQVTAKSETNLRTVASTSDDNTIVHKLLNGEFVTRTGIGTNGWSRVIYNGQTLYAKTSYLTTSTETTTQAPETTTAFDPFADKSFIDMNDQVTAKVETSLRTVPNTKGNDPVYTLKNGEYVTRTGVTNTDTSIGWSRVIYNGQTLYAVSSYLTN